MIVRYSPLLLILALLIGLNGCASGDTGKVKVRGKLLNHGKIISPKPEDIVEIAFYPVDAAAPGMAGATAIYEPSDGTFVVEGPKGQGALKPGEYRILLSWMPYAGGEKSDRFKGQFTILESSLVYTVTDAKDQEIIIDAGKKTVTPKS